MDSPSGHVDRGEAGLAAEFFQSLHAGLAAFLGQVADHDMRAGLGEART